MRRALLPLTLLVAAISVAGCSSSPGDETPDAGLTDGGDNTNPDGGDADGDGGTEPEPCASDFDDCGEKEICDLVSGECVAGAQCNPDYEYLGCNIDGEGDPAPGFGCGGSRVEDCVCDSSDNTCRKRRALCETCETDEECGSTYSYERPAFCVDFQGAKHCLTRNVSGRLCPTGFEPNAEKTYCIPVDEKSCDGPPPCKTDDECPATAPICNTLMGACMPACSFDLATGKSDGCSDGKVCHQDGRCRAPCDPANDTCGQVNPEYVCKEEVNDVFRCRHAGCIDDVECPVPGDGIYAGYCDMDRHVCVDDNCRPGLTRADTSNPDCKPSYKCEPLNGSATEGSCTRMNCAERGGAAVGCGGAGNLCCDECRNVDVFGNVINPERDPCDPLICNGTEEPTPSPDDLEGCIVAPTPPWCVPCSSQAECSALENPKEDARDINLCLADGLCAPTCGSVRDCPTGYDCVGIKAPCNPQAVNACGPGGMCVDDGPWSGDCTSSSECPDFYECVMNDAVGKTQCHMPYYVCDCAAGGKPSDANCPAQTAEMPASRCAADGQGYRCLISRVCRTNGDGLCGEE